MHLTFTEKQTNYLLEYCNKHNKHISGGSDYHGSNRPSTELGVGLGNLNISAEIIETWVK